ncbi:hypothetical protein [Fibrobacter sp. UWB13]|uniref:hypothetical protein n=1 Tax=Fibrobacter sp. UWB13 TaxID=1896204 RepID=UPI000A0B2643|nr:hypothetical protein [Fibrobacter sp. UWB13]SMG40795.1 hypothetical protein SAMN05720489_2811 [Fibrobacter sp. UWB13]
MRLIFATAVALFAVQAFAANGIMKGDGSIAKPFQIEDYEDLKSIGKNAYLYSSNYIVTKDIDASASEHEYCNGHVCNSFIAIGQVQNSTAVIPFSGSIDGQDHVIKNLRIWLPCLHYVGFIAQLEGSLSNLKFEHLRVYGGYDTDYAPHSDYVGGVVGLSKGQITNVHVKDGHVEGLRYVGGLVGQLETNKSFVSNSSFEGVVQGRRNVGGLIGTLEGHVQESFADVEIFVGINKESKNVGGLVGESNSRVHPSITKSYATGIIVPEVEKAASNIGGLVGLNEDGFVELSYASVDIMSFNQGYFSECIGGLVGLNKAKISEAYATGNVTGYGTVGGLVGENSRGGQIEYSYAMGSVKVLRNEYLYAGSFAGGNWGSIYGSYSVGKIELPNDRDSAYLYVSGFSEGDSVNSCYWNVDLAGIDTSEVGIGLSDAAMKHLSSFAGWEEMSKCNFKFEYEGHTSHIYEACDFFEEISGDSLRIWNIDEGESYPYLANLGKNAKATANIIAVAVPTKAAKWQEKPIVAAEKDVGYELFGKWLELVRLNETKDSIYYSYRIGYANESDTVWGTTSYMAVPNHIEIATFEDLKKIGNSISHPLLANYELVEDIDASSSNFTPIGEERKPFTGTFEGNNHVIEGLTVDTQNQFYAGLFGFASQSSIKNLVFKNSKVSGGEYAGVLGGQIEKSFISNVVSYDGDVKGDDQVGGLIGAAYKDSILKVGSTGTVKGSRNVGGLIGCFASYLKDGYAVSVVKGHEDVGGAIGGSNARLLIGDTVYNVYAASILKGPKNNLNGVIGDHINNSEGIFENFYYDGGLTQIVHAYNRNVTEGTVLSSEEMLRQASFENFDFDGVWTIQEGKSYPYFEGTDAVLPGKLVDDGTINILDGEGTDERPYLISSYEDLKYIGKYEYGLDKVYKLTHLINASASAEENCVDGVCAGFEPIGGKDGFSGKLIGGEQQHQLEKKVVTEMFGIYNLTINRPSEDYVGLFTKLNPKSEISHMAFFDNTIVGKNYVGSIAGLDEGAVIDSILTDTLSISGHNYVGVIAGAKEGGSAKHVYINPEANVSGKKYVGSFVGSSKKTFYWNAWSMARVSGDSYVGGFAGIDSASTYKNIACASHVQGQSKTGNVMGETSKSTFTSVYYDGEVWEYDNSSVGKSMTTKEMLDISSYENWDFQTTWTQTSSSCYPVLAWFAMGNTCPTTLHPKFQMKGSGTEKDPFIVKTYEDLKAIGYGKYKLSSVYQLANDIDASASNEEGGFLSFGNYKYDSYFGVKYEHEGTIVFTGKFHGKGHAIKRIDIVSVGIGGLFYTIGEDAVVDSLRMEVTQGLKMSAALALENKGLVDYVKVVADTIDVDGGLVYENEGTIRNSTFKGSIKDGSGLVTTNKGLISACTTWVDVFDARYNGGSGFVNENRGTIENSVANGSIKGRDVAGFALKVNADGVIRNSHASVDVNGAGFVQENFGDVVNCFATGTAFYGFVSTNKGNIEKSFAIGNSIDSTSNSRAFANSNEGNIRKSYSLGKGHNYFIYVNGGLIEDSYAIGVNEFWVKMDTGVVKNSYIAERPCQKNAEDRKLTDLSACVVKDNVYFEYDPKNHNREGLFWFPEYLHRQKTFTGFDFDSVWYIKEGVTYPLLRGMPNMPVATGEAVSFESNKSLANNVRNKLLDEAIILDTAAVKVLKLDSASSALVDSLAKAKSPSGKFDLTYRVGVVLSSDTLWSAPATAEMKLNKSNGIPDVAVKRGFGFAAMFQGTRLSLLFEIPKAASVKFSLVDMQGRVVRTADLGQRTAGNYFETLDVAELARGRYVGILHVGDRPVEKAVLLKK